MIFPPKHVTLRYLWDRAALFVYESQHPGSPWLTPQSVSELGTLLRPTDRGIEFGSGRSTVWLAKRTAHLTSVETSPAWARRVAASLKHVGMSDRVDLRLVPANQDLAHDAAKQEYIRIVKGAGENSLDYVLVDGIYRDECALAATAALAIGGLLIIDNIERYVHTDTRAPERLRAVASPKWTQFQQRVALWRSLWSTSGVTDTAIWIKTD